MNQNELEAALKRVGKILNNRNYIVNEDRLRLFHEVAEKVYNLFSNRIVDFKVNEMMIFGECVAIYVFNELIITKDDIEQLTKMPMSFEFYPGDGGTITMAVGIRGVWEVEEE